MTNERIPNDPHRSGSSDHNFERAAKLDNEAQPDPGLQEGRVNSGWATIVAIAIAVVLGVVFYGLNNSDMHEASTAPPTQTAQTQPAPPATPHANTAPNPNASPGVTTGAAPTRPTPPATTPKPNPQAGDNPTGQTHPGH